MQYGAYREYLRELVQSSPGPARFDGDATQFFRVGHCLGFQNPRC